MCHSVLWCVYIQLYERECQLSGKSMSVCDYAHSARLMRRVLIQQRKSKIDAGSIHAVMSLNADSRSHGGDIFCSVCED